MRSRHNNSQLTTHNSKFVIRASEIGEYNYCSRAWWYRHVAKIPPPDTKHMGRLAVGTRAHARHGRAVAVASILRRGGIALAACGALMLILALILMRI